MGKKSKGNKDYVVGIDFGGTKILTALVDGQGRIVAETKRRTAATQGPDRIISRIAKSVKAVMKAGKVSEEEVLAGKSSETVSLLVKPGETVELTEEGAHIELFDLSRPFEEGETFTATLFFEQAGPVKITVTVGEE